MRTPLERFGRETTGRHEQLASLVAHDVVGHAGPLDEVGCCVGGVFEVDPDETDIVGAAEADGLEVGHLPDARPAPRREEVHDERRVAGERLQADRSAVKGSQLDVQQTRRRCRPFAGIRRLIGLPDRHQEQQRDAHQGDAHQHEAGPRHGEEARSLLSCHDEETHALLRAFLA